MTQADEQFIKTCKEIIKNGYTSKGTNVRTRWDDGEEANYFSIVGVQNKYDVGKEFPMITLRNNTKTFKNAIDEILWIWQKKSNKISELHSHIWDQWANQEGTIGKAYGYQLGKKYEFKTKEGIKIYRRTLIYIMGKAFQEVYPEALITVDYQLANEMYCEIDNMQVDFIMRRLPLR